MRLDRLPIITASMFALVACGETGPNAEGRAAAEEAGQLLASALGPVQTTASVGGQFVGDDKRDGLSPAQDRPLQNMEDAQAAVDGAKTRVAATEGAAELGGTGCPVWSLAMGTLTLDYGSGCNAGSTMIAGTIAIAVALDTRFGVALTFTNYQVDGGDILDGTFSLELSEGLTDALFDFQVDDGSVVESVVLAGSVQVTMQTMILNGEIGYSDGTTNSNVSLNGVEGTINGCWAYGGTADVELATLTGKVIFLSTTPDDGMVDVEVPNLLNPEGPPWIIPYQLPPTGACSYTVP